MGEGIQYRCPITGMYPEEEKEALNRLQQQNHKLASVISGREDYLKAKKNCDRKYEELKKALVRYNS